MPFVRRDFPRLDPFFSRELPSNSTTKESSLHTEPRKEKEEEEEDDGFLTVFINFNKERTCCSRKRMNAKAGKSRKLVGERIEENEISAISLRDAAGSVEVETPR